MIVSESRDPTGDTGTGADFTDIATWRLRTAQYLVADVLESDTEITAEAAVRDGAMVQTPTPPTKTDTKLGAADRTVAMKVCWHIRNDGLSHRHPQEKGKHL